MEMSPLLGNQEPGQTETLPNDGVSRSMLTSRSEYKSPEHSTSSSCQQRCSSQTKLHFEPDADITFKVLYTDVVMGEWQSFTLDQRVATLSHARNLLSDAQQTFGTHQLLPTWFEAVQGLQAKITNVIENDTQLAGSIQQRLLDYRTTPHTVLDRRSLEEWYNDARTFLQHAEDLTEICVVSDVQIARETVDRTYDQLLSLPMAQTPVEAITPMEDQDTTNDAEIHTLHKYLPSMGLDCDQTEKSILKRFKGLFKVYEALNTIVQDQESLRFKSFLSTELADILRTIQGELLYLLGHFGSESSLKDQCPRSNLIEILCRGCCHALVSKSKNMVQNKLALHLQNIQRAMNSEACHSLETEFIQLASTVSTFEMPTPPGVLETEWNGLAPRMLTSTEARNFSSKLQLLYATYQDKVYNTEELSHLWLNIWRGLKATYLIIRRSNFCFSADHFPVESTFFNRVSVRNQFELVLSSSEPLNHVVIENIVGEYCIFVAESQRLPGLESIPLKQLKPTTVETSIIDAIDIYVEGGCWSDVAVYGIQKCAVRLNHLINGPAFIRRTSSSSVSVPTTSASKWTIERVVLRDDFSTLPSPPRARSALTLPGEGMDKLPARLRGPLTVASRSRSSVTDIRSSANLFDRQANDRRILTAPDNDEELDADGSDKAADSSLFSMNAVSAFDYVVYPFPETRALEVAQSRQISRDLSEPGIFSRGALEHDVVNRPPRHTWPPGKISIWAKPLPIDPLNVLKELWSEIRHGVQPVKPLKQAKPRPFITPRRPRKEWADEHPRLKPLRDLNRRVTKHKNRRTPHDNDRTSLGRSYPIALPKLRGGGSNASTPASNANPVTPVPLSTNTGILSQAEMNVRTQQLMDRIRGSWRGGDLPPVNLIHQYFLVPNNWDVDAAHDAARRFVNYGLLDDMTGYGNQNSYGDQQPPNSNPFLAAGVNRGLGLNPLQFGMPITRGAIVPFGNGGSFRSSPITPTPQGPPRVLARVSPHLQPILPAHMVPTHAQTPDTTGAINPQNAFSTSGLPAAFQIYEDSPGHHTPVPLGASPRIFAPNQHHQAQIDRSNAGLPPHRSSDNSSNQENTTPMTPRTASWRRLTPSSPPQVSTGRVRCSNVICHPCPQYEGQYHHICTGQVPQPIRVSSGFLSTQQQTSPSLGRSNRNTQTTRPRSFVFGGNIPDDAMTARVTGTSNRASSIPADNSWPTWSQSPTRSADNGPSLNNRTASTSNNRSSSALPRQNMPSMFRNPSTTSTRQALANLFSGTQNGATVSPNNNSISSLQANPSSSPAQQPTNQNTTTPAQSIPDSQDGTPIRPFTVPAPALQAQPTTPAQVIPSSASPPARQSPSSGRNSSGGARIVPSPVTPTPRARGRGRGRATGTGSGRSRGRGATRGRVRGAAQARRVSTPAATTAAAAAAASASASDTSLRRSTRTTRGQKRDFDS